MSSTRVKDAGFIQQHIEKLVLAAGVLVFFVAVMLFIVGNPYAIELGNKKYDSAKQVVDELKTGESRLRAGLDKPNPLPPIKTPNFAADYAKMLAQPVISGNKLPNLSVTGLTDATMTPDIPPPPRYALPTPPVPTKVSQIAASDVLETDFNPQIVNAYFQLIGERRDPADFSAVIIAAQFSTWDWMKRLTNKSVDEGETAIPLGISTQRFGISGVLLVREEEISPGTWGNRVVVEPLPNQIRYLPDNKVSPDPAQAMEIVTFIREAQLQVTQPELPLLNGFIQAVPPIGDGLREGADGFNAFGIDAAIALGPAEQKIKLIEEQIAELMERQREREERKTPRRDGEGGGGPDGFDRPDKTERKDPLTRQIEKLQERITGLQPRANKEAEVRQRKLEEQKLREERRLRDNAFDRGTRPGTGPDGQGNDAAENLQLQKDATVDVWAADVTMQPGKTYRYKVLVAVINPLYAVPHLEKDQLAANLTRAAILPSAKEIENMPWGEPIRIEPRTRFFFTSGNEVSGKTTVYRRVNGIYMSHTFDVSPGDPIGGKFTTKPKDQFDAPKTHDLSVGAVVIDIERRRDAQGKTYYAMIYMDKEGNLSERLQDEDSNNPESRTLDEQVELGIDRVWPLRPGGRREGQFDN